MKYNYLQGINESKFMAGIAMLMLNIGSRYVSIGLSKSQEEYLTTSLARQMLIFSVAFIGTKDLVISLVLTIVFIIFADYVFNEKSKFCVIPKQMRKLHNEIDLDKDGIISDKELTVAIETLTKAKKRKQERSNLSNYPK